MSSRSPKEFDGVQILALRFSANVECGGELEVKAIVGSSTVSVAKERRGVRPFRRAGLVILSESSRSAIFNRLKPGAGCGGGRRRHLRSGVFCKSLIIMSLRRDS